MKLYLVRHGQSVGNVKKTFYGSTDYPLTDAGRAQARELGERLRDIPFSRCYASPYVRAHDTARLIVGSRGTPIEVRDGLREQSMGEFEDRSFEDVLEKDPEFIDNMLGHWSLADPPGGESFDTVRKRVALELESIVKAGEDALIVAHAGSLCAAICELLSLSPLDADRLLFEQGRYTCVEMGYFPRLVCFNR